MSKLWCIQTACPLKQLQHREQKERENTQIKVPLQQWKQMQGAQTVRAGHAHCGCCSFRSVSLGGTEYFPNLFRTACYSLPWAQRRNCIPGLRFFQSSISFLTLLSTKNCYLSRKLIKSQLLSYYCSLMNIIMHSIQYIF